MRAVARSPCGRRSTGVCVQRQIRRRRL